MSAEFPRGPENNDEEAARLAHCRRSLPSGGGRWRRLPKACKKSFDASAAIWLRLCDGCERVAKALSPFKVAVICVAIALDVTLITYHRELIAMVQEQAPPAPPTPR